MSRTHLGKPFPLGSSITTRGVNFSVAAPAADRVELLLFDNSTDSCPEKVIELTSDHRSGDYWHIEVEGIGAGCCYGYRVFAPSEFSNHHFYSSKVLLDPAARAISGWNVYRRNLAAGLLPNTHACLKSVVTERNCFDFDAHPRPYHPWNRTVVYELHVGNFTQQQDSGVPSEHRGTLIGLIAKLPYLQDLGVTAVELLPVYCFDQNDAPLGRKNVWGYSPINWFTPHPAYISGNNSLEARQQVRDLVAACHDSGLEILLDVVYNHTTEGGIDGPTVSWRGFGDHLYYHQTSNGDYLDVSGCGNSIAANHPLVRYLILESLRCWAIELGVDGFRFDLGIALSRGDGLTPLDRPPLFESIEADPALSNLKLVSEPWDCGGLYRLADFPAHRIGVWNGKFRDTVRSFWKGDENTSWQMGQQLRGNFDTHKSHLAPLGKSVNFVTAHDGFTLYDLVSFNSKHNLANGENNCDGESHNLSWNHGIEGPSNDPATVALRQRQQRNLITTLLLARGVPMLLMGDEVGRSQGGNNNSWCQDNILSWMVWNSDQSDSGLHTYIQRLLRVRYQLADLLIPTRIVPLKQQQENLEGIWQQWHGVELGKPDWAHWSHSVAYSLNRGKYGAVLWVGFNAYFKAIRFKLPQASSPWHCLINTALLPSMDLPEKLKSWLQPSILVKNRSLVVLIAQEYVETLSPTSTCD